MKKDTILFGIIFGLVVPFVTYAILLEINDYIIAMEIELAGGRTFEGFSKSMLTVFAICANLIPFQYFIKRRWDYAMRGVIFPTLFYGFYWAIYFGKLIFDF